MVAILGFVIFAGAFAMAVTVIGMMLLPQWDRIVSLAAGRAEVSFAPLAQLAVAEQRIAVRRWAARPVPAAINRLSAAA